MNKPVSLKRLNEVIADRKGQPMDELDESAYEPWKDDYDEEQQIADHEGGE